MSETSKDDRRFVVVNGEKVSYDAKVIIYFDSETGNWVVNSTPMHAETVADLLAEVLDYFSQALDSDVVPLPDSDDPEDVEDIVLMPMPSQDFH